jgi:PAS domain-containing protein
MPSALCRTLTKRKMLEAKNEELAALVNSTDDAVTGLDLDRKITVWNGGAEHLFGYSKKRKSCSYSSSPIPCMLRRVSRS